MGCQNPPPQKKAPSVLRRWILLGLVLAGGGGAFVFREEFHARLSWQDLLRRAMLVLGPRFPGLLSGQQPSAKPSPSEPAARRKHRRSMPVDAAGFAPEWARSERRFGLVNESYLSQGPGSFSLPGLEQSNLLLRLGKSWDERFVWSARSRFSRASEQYELRRHHGQSQLSTQTEHLRELREIGNSGLQQLSRSFFREEVLDSFLAERAMDQAEQVSRQVGDWARDLSRSDQGTAVRAVGTLLGAAAFLTTGRAFSFELQESWKLVAQANLLAQSSEMRLLSPYLDSSMVFRGNIPAQGGPRLLGQERYRLSFGRSFTAWRLRSGLSYGSTSGLVTASLTRELLPHLYATALTSRASDPQRAFFPGEQSLSLNYLLRF
jgi:hypothetical protein